MPAHALSVVCAERVQEAVRAWAEARIPAGIRHRITFAPRAYASASPWPGPLFPLPCRCALGAGDPVLSLVLLTAAMAGLRLHRAAVQIRLS